MAFCRAATQKCCQAGHEWGGGVLQPLKGMVTAHMAVGRGWHPCCLGSVQPLWEGRPVAACTYQRCEVAAVLLSGREVLMQQPLEETGSC